MVNINKVSQLLGANDLPRTPRNSLDALVQGEKCTGEGEEKRVLVSYHTWSCSAAQFYE